MILLFFMLNLVNGVIIVIINQQLNFYNMRKLLFLLLILFLYFSNVQGQSGLHIDYATPSDPAKQPLVLLDGEKYSDPEFMHSIDPSSIYSLEVLKGHDVQSYVDKYGDLAKNGVISVTTKGFVAKQWYNRFAKYQPTIKIICKREDFDYNSYRVFLNEQLLNNQDLKNWDSQFENQNIKNVDFKSINFGEIKGEVRVATKCDKTE